MNLEQRIARLEALEAVRLLKHRYLNACDLKDVETIRACFAEGPITIDYGPVGTFQERDSFVALYQSLACNERVIDLHHGANPELEHLVDDEVAGRWALYYFNVDAETGATRQLGGVYQDRYRRIGGQWKIVETVFRAHSMVEGGSTSS
ncbi:nuclear transport factor 2 family protein [Pseudomonas sp. JS3066]|uniref:nuclear transport factor 2 family protein n=1 Tax=unclassified Pseudomonas TaxID=196821 RepID=UPI00129ED422|nr:MULTISPECIES: nuclear transport factor 2 family protein [unclassified Pseudomonas]MDH4653996.1 nuclear transport factor 2 family protein [Pseudomonas sp. BN606]MRK23341.1 nuclear transport factor 2 family protein [Pseudomonas sp. JG-B]WVK94429.1 nuclear transport factor 2 family protein [Pseudomonas sp. JS3066]